MFKAKTKNITAVTVTLDSKRIKQKFIYFSNSVYKMSGSLLARVTNKTKSLSLGNFYSMKDLISKKMLNICYLEMLIKRDMRSTQSVLLELLESSKIRNAHIIQLNIYAII